MTWRRRIIRIIVLYLVLAGLNVSMNAAGLRPEWLDFPIDLALGMVLAFTLPRRWLR